MYKKRIQKVYFHFVRRREIGTFRVKDDRTLPAVLGDASRSGAGVPCQSHGCARP
jgi:hypothetical protein